MHNMYTWIILLLCLSISFWGGHAQHSKTQLEKKRGQNLWRIKKNSRMLSEIRTKKKVSVGELSLIREQIIVQKKLIQSIQKEIESLQEDIEKVSDIIDALENDLVNLQREYGEMIYATAKSSSLYNRLGFLFASSSVNQAYRRIKYLQQYSKARKKQVGHIREASNTLIQQREKAKAIKKEKNKLLAQKSIEMEVLEQLKEEKKRLITQLAKQEVQLRKELQTSKTTVAKLDKLIADMVGGNVRRKHKKKTGHTKKNKLKAEELTKKFVQQKGRLPFPVSKGFVAVGFGKQPHPVLKDVMIDNAGIDIQTPKGQGVKAVFEGKVSTIATIPGMGGKVIMIQHGKFFTVYARVEGILVSAGDWIEAGQPIAVVFTDKNGTNRLQFQVWENSTKLNPIAWIKR